MQWQSNHQPVVLEPLRTSLYDGLVPVPVVAPKFNYLGPPMPLRLWQQVLCWFKTHDKGEVVKYPQLKLGACGSKA